MWTNRAKEKVTKRQFASFAASHGLGQEWRTHLKDLCRRQGWLPGFLSTSFLFMYYIHSAWYTNPESTVTNQTCHPVPVV